jgi:predicted GNAT superfamily acetyltransferase
LRPGDVADVTALNNDNIPAVNAKTDEQMAAMIAEATWAIGAFEAEAIDDESNEESGGALLGFLLTFTPGAAYESVNFAWFSANYDRFAYMDRIVVDPSARGGGIGAALYAELFSLIGETASSVGIDVNTRPANEGSLRFHRRLGFEQVHEQETEGGAKTVALMIRTLP